MNPRLDELPHPPLAKSGRVVLRLGTLAAIGRGNCLLFLNPGRLLVTAEALLGRGDRTQPEPELHVTSCMRVRNGQRGSWAERSAAAQGGGTLPFVVDRPPSDRATRSGAQRPTRAAGMAGQGASGRSKASA
jgi:hypothetical protein